MFFYRHETVKTANVSYSWPLPLGYNGPTVFGFFQQLTAIFTQIYWEKFSIIGLTE